MNYPPATVGFISLGCAKNLVDSQIMAGTLLSNGVVLAETPEQADVVIINTCAFIEDAREESIENILSVCGLKEAGTVKAVLVAGCLPQRYKQELAESLPEVDAFIGLDELDRVADIVKRLACGERRMCEVSERATRLFAPGKHTPVFSGGPFAYLKIAEGCDHPCAFCAIPGIRGAQRSRLVSEIVKEADQLLDAGYRELDLISQDVTSYGRDRGDGSNLTTLLHALSEHDGQYWLRVLYGHPSGITADLLRTMSALEPVCAYLDIPIQHSHPQILRAMQRADTVEFVGTMAQRVRKHLPGAALRTTCLVGFPGETEEHFEHLVNYVRSAEFDHLGVFVFSPEDNTPAAQMPNCPDSDVAEQRRETLLLVQKEIVDRKACALVGNTAEVLLERPVPGEESAWVGRSRCQAPEVDGEVIVQDVPARIEAGAFIAVRYIAQADYDMRATSVKREA